MIMPLAMLTSSIGAYYHSYLLPYTISHPHDSHILYLSPRNRHCVHEFLVRRPQHRNNHLPLLVLWAKCLLDDPHRVPHGADYSESWPESVPVSSDRLHVCPKLLVLLGPHPRLHCPLCAAEP